MEMLTKCDYCNLLVKQLTELRNEFEKDKSNELLLAMRAYYSILSEFLDWFAKNGCDTSCYETIMSLNALKQYYFKTLTYYDQEPDAGKMGCYVCKFLPSIIFGLLDKICSVENEQELHQMNLELQFHAFLLIVSENTINSCQQCDYFINYRAIVGALYRYLDNQDINELNQFVLVWKTSTNLDNILACNDKVRNLERPVLSQVDLTGYTTYYLDFNIYDIYEKVQKIKDFLDGLLVQDKVQIVYSLSHLEEIPRMNNAEYENKRLETIKTLTKGYMEFGDKNGRIAFYTCEINSFYDYAKHYESMNDFAESEECIYAELEKTLLKKYNGKYSSDIGNQTLRGIIANARKMQSGNEKYAPDMPSIEDMNYILGKVGIGGRMIDEYENIFVKKDITLHELRVSILSLSRLMNIIGLHADKIKKKGSKDAVYPIYGNDSFRTIRSSYYDIDHLTLASKCTFFITCDKTLFQKASNIYSFLGIKTQPIYIDKKDYSIHFAESTTMSPDAQEQNT